jgi:hypothetical protein
MYFHDPAPAEGAKGIAVTTADALAIGVAAAAIIALGLFPSGLIELARIAG